MRLLEVLQRSTAFLAERGVDSPRLQAEWVLAHVLRLPRLRLYLEFEREVSDAELDTAREMVRRRGQRVPLQHLLGTTSFCGLELECTKDALVPRPETELLAERAWGWLGETAGVRPTAPEVLDWGTGSGCLAIAVAVRCPEARVTAVDLSAAALALARRNAARHGCEGRIDFVESDGCQALPADTRFNLVVANPPYIPSGDLGALEPEVRDHDPRLALDGGADGLDVCRRLAGELAVRCRPGAAWLLEFGEGQAPGLERVLLDAGWIVAERHRDYSGRDRFLLAQRGGDDHQPMTQDGG